MHLLEIEQREEESCQQLHLQNIPKSGTKTRQARKRRGFFALPLMPLSGES